MKFTKVFWVTLVIMIILFILPTIRTYSAPFIDGIRVYGFPLIYGSVGGYCPAGCENNFNYLNLLIDLVILIVTPFISNMIFLKFKDSFM